MKQMTLHGGINGQLLGHEESDNQDKFQAKGCTPRANKRGNAHMVWASRNFRLGFFSKSKISINFSSLEGGSESLSKF